MLKGLDDVASRAHLLDCRQCREDLDWADNRVRRQGQFFIDGNKRIGLVAMLTFLEINGAVVAATDHELADWILGLSAGGTPIQLAKQIRSASRSIG
jgi:prophage maintenance system killer protein